MMRIYIHACMEMEACMHFHFSLLHFQHWLYDMTVRPVRSYYWRWNDVRLTYASAIDDAHIHACMHGDGDGGLYAFPFLAVTLPALTSTSHIAEWMLIYDMTERPVRRSYYWRWNDVRVTYASAIDDAHIHGCMEMEACISISRYYTSSIDFMTRQCDLSAATTEDGMM